MDAGEETHRNSGLNKMFISPSSKNPQVSGQELSSGHLCEFLRDPGFFQFIPHLSLSSEFEMVVRAPLAHMCISGQMMKEEVKKKGLKKVLESALQGFHLHPFGQNMLHMATKEAAKCHREVIILRSCMPR